MKKDQLVRAGLVIFVLLIVFSFYWFEWRPAQARIACENEASGERSPNWHEARYQHCLRAHGIEATHILDLQ